jgi:hypothetical protein
MQLVELKIKALLATFAAAKLKAEAWASKAAELREVLSQAARGSEAAQELLEAVDKPSPCKSSPRSRSTRGSANKRPKLQQPKRLSSDSDYEEEEEGDGAKSRDENVMTLRFVHYSRTHLQSYHTHCGHIQEASYYNLSRVSRPMCASSRP